MLLLEVSLLLLLRHLLLLLLLVTKLRARLPLWPLRPREERPRLLLLETLLELRVRAPLLLLMLKLLLRAKLLLLSHLSSSTSSSVHHYSDSTSNSVSPIPERRQGLPLFRQSRHRRLTVEEPSREPDTGPRSGVGIAKAKQRGAARAARGGVGEKVRGAHELPELASRGLYVGVRRPPV